MTRAAAARDWREGPLLGSAAALGWEKPLTREREIIAAGMMVVAGSFAYPYVRGPLSALTPGCMFRRITGLPCLLCGMTRSLAATSRGRLGEAFRHHLLGPPLFALVVGVTLLLTGEEMLGRTVVRRPSRRERKTLSRAALGLLVAAWVSRLALFGAEV